MKRIKVLKAYFIIWLFILFIVYANFELLSTFFMATVVFSTAVLGVLLVGTLYQLISGYGIVMLGGTFGALAYKKTGYEFYLRSIDKILPANIAHMLYSRKNQQKMLFTQDESRNIVEWLEDKFRKQKAYINFFINTSMLIGLLGTFVGLVESIDEMGQIILSLNGDVNIQKVMQDFSGPLTGMAIGFGASLFGVVTAVILGINGYVLFRYQDMLIDGIEDWLKDRIIDIVPESLGGGTQGTALPEQRKSFMDVFIEQMDSFTKEISKMSESNTAITVMSDSLSSIKHLLESEREVLRSMAEHQEKQQANFEALTNAILASREESDRRLSEERTMLYSLLQNNIKVAERSDVALQNIDANMVSIEQNITLQRESASVMVSLGEKISKEQEKSKAEMIEAMSAINTAIAHDSRAFVDFATSNEEKNQQIANVLDDIASSSKILEQKLDRGNQSLLGVAESQERQYEIVSKNGSELLGGINALKDIGKNQLTALEEFTSLQDGANKKTVSAQVQIAELLASITGAIAKEQETLTAILNMQNDGKHENNKRFTQAISSLSEFGSQLLNVKTSIDSVLKLQNENISKQNHFNDALIHGIDTTNAILLEGSKREDRILLLSEDSIEAQKRGFAVVSDAIAKLSSEILSVEQKISKYAGENLELQTNTLKLQEDRQSALLNEFSGKTENVQDALNNILDALREISEKVGSLDISSSVSGTDKKGFFSSLFGKNRSGE